LEGFLGYALAKSGKEAEARSLLEGLLNLGRALRFTLYHRARLQRLRRARRGVGLAGASLCAAQQRDGFPEGRPEVE